MTSPTIRTSEMLMALGLMVVFVPGLTGAAIPSGWLFLLVTLPWFLWKRIDMGVAHWLGVTFFAFASLSLLWSSSPLNGVMTIVQFIVIGMAFVFGQRCDLRSVGIGLGLGLLPSSFFAMVQWFEGEPIIGMFISQSLTGDIGALVLIVLVSQRLWWLVPVTLPCIILAGTKSPYIALAVAYCVWGWQNRQRENVIIVLASAAFILTATYSFGFRVGGTLQRLEIWEGVIPYLTWLGHGAGSFEQDYLNVILETHERTAYAHSDFLQLAYEFGIASTLIFAIAAPLLRHPIFCAWIALAAFQWPLEYPVTAFIGALAAGVAYRERASIRDLRLPRRSTIHERREQHYA